MTEELKPPVSRVLPILSAAELVPEPPLHGAVAAAWNALNGGGIMSKRQIDESAEQIPANQRHRLPPSHPDYQPKE